MSLRAIVGKDVKGTEVGVDLGALTLIGGSAGRGKTTLIKNIIRDLKLNYTNVDIKVLDIKGIEYVNDGVALINDINDLNSVIDTMFELIDSRKDLFIKEGCSSIEEYLSIPDSVLRYKVIVVENYDVISDTSNKEEKVILDKLYRLVAVCRCFGISVILSSQKDRGNRSLMANASNLIEFPSVFNGYLAKELGLDLKDGLTDVGTFVLLDSVGVVTVVNSNYVTKKDIATVFSEKEEGLSIEIGKDNKGRDVYLNMDNGVLLSGMCAIGKTNALCNIVDNILKKDKSTEIILISHRGVELNNYKNNSNIAIVDYKTKEAVEKCIDGILNDLDGRKGILERSDCRTIESYNSKNATKLPYKVLCIDGALTILSYNDISHKLAYILSQCRHLGVKVVLTTQGERRLDGSISSNISNHMSFRKYDYDLSISKRLVNLDRGECVLLQDGKEIVVQTPLNKNMI